MGSLQEVDAVLADYDLDKNGVLSFEVVAVHELAGVCTPAGVTHSAMCVQEFATMYCTNPSFQFKATDKLKRCPVCPVCLLILLSACVGFLICQYVCCMFCN